MISRDKEPFRAWRDPAPAQGGKREASELACY